MTKFKTLALSTSLLTLFSVSAFARVSCPEAPVDHTNNKSRSALEAGGINVIGNVSPEFMNSFMFEFAKFPSDLNREMVNRGATLNIMEGTGVTVDPSWTPVNVATFDGRPWSDVPGSGGSNAMGYSTTPTRVVVNHLYDNHGSINLLLHERAHGLDNLYLLDGISSSNAWKSAMRSSPGITEFLGEICVQGYCDAHDNEGFAELFAYYHACEESREDLKSRFPVMADFMKNLRNSEQMLARSGEIQGSAAQMERKAQQDHQENWQRQQAEIARQEREAREAQRAQERVARQGSRQQNTTQAPSIDMDEVGDNLKEFGGNVVRGGRNFFNSARDRFGRMRSQNRGEQTRTQNLNTQSPAQEGPSRMERVREGAEDAAGVVTRNTGRAYNAAREQVRKIEVPAMPWNKK